MLARDIQSIMAGSDPTFTDCKHWLAPTDITFLRVTTCHECHDVVTRFGQLSIIIITTLKTWNKTNWIENKPNLMKKLELARCEKSDHAMWRCPRQWLGLAPYLQDARLNLRERRETLSSAFTGAQKNYKVESRNNCLEQFSKTFDISCLELNLWT